MLRVTVGLLASLFLSFVATAQEEVFSHPFEWPNVFSESGQTPNVMHKCYAVENKTDSNFCLVLRNHKNIEYLLLNKKDFSVIGSAMPAENSLWQLPKGQPTFGGATGMGKNYNFVFYRNRYFYLQQVNFETKQVNYSPLFTLGNYEILRAIFTHNNVCYAISCIAKVDSLIIRTINDKGELSRKALPLSAPKEAAPKGMDLFHYIGDIAVFDGKTASDFGSLGQFAKIFLEEEKMYLMLQDRQIGTRIITISPSSFSVENDQYVDYGNLNDLIKEGGVRVNCQIRNEKLYTAIRTQKSFLVTIQEFASQKHIITHEITEKTDLTSTVSLAVDAMVVNGEVWEEKQINTSRGLIRLTSLNFPWISVSSNNDEQEVISAGSVVTDIMRGGYGSLVTYDKVSYFKKVVDNKTYASASGTYNTTQDRRKSYIASLKYKKVHNLFYLSNTPYFGYYNHDTKKYIIERLDME